MHDTVVRRGSSVDRCIIDKKVMVGIWRLTGEISRNEHGVIKIYPVFCPVTFRILWFGLIVSPAALVVTNQPTDFRLTIELRDGSRIVARLVITTCYFALTFWVTSSCR